MKGVEAKEYFGEVLDGDSDGMDSDGMDPDDICSGIQASVSTAPPAKRAKGNHKDMLLEIAKKSLKEQQKQTEIMSRMADSQAKFQSELLDLLRIRL